MVAPVTSTAFFFWRDSRILSMFESPNTLLSLDWSWGRCCCWDGYYRCFCCRWPERMSFHWIRTKKNICRLVAVGFAARCQVFRLLRVLPLLAEDVRGLWWNTLAVLYIGTDTVWVLVYCSRGSWGIFGASSFLFWWMLDKRILFKSTGNRGWSSMGVLLMGFQPILVTLVASNGLLLFFCLIIN